MSSYVEQKPLSLVERKKLQWAREKGDLLHKNWIRYKNETVSDEMAMLTAPWGTKEYEASLQDKMFARYQFIYIPRITSVLIISFNQNESR